VVRIPKDKSLRASGVLRDAKPCAKCCKTLLELGFRKIACSNENNEIELIDLRKYQNTHLSTVQKLMEKHCKY